MNIYRTDEFPEPDIRRQHPYVIGYYHTKEGKTFTAWHIPGQDEFHEADRARGEHIRARCGRESCWNY